MATQSDRQGCTSGVVIGANSTIGIPSPGVRPWVDGGRHHSNRGREDGAGPLLAVALDRSSGVACFRDHFAADLVAVADAPREGLRSKPLSCAPVARTSLRIFGNGGLSPRMYLRKEFRDGWGQARSLPSHRRRGSELGREMESDRFWLLVGFWLLLVIGAVTMLVIVLANRP